MGTKNRERRAAKRRRTAERLHRQRTGGAPDPGSGPAPGPGHRPGPEPTDVELLVAAGARHAHFGSPEVPRLVAALVAAGTPAGAPGAAAVRALDRQLTAAVTELWEQGWQPLDVAHVARRNGSGRLARLAVRVIVAQAAASDAQGRAPDAWVHQLGSLPAKGAGGPPGRAVTQWQAAEDLDAADALVDALRLLGLLLTLHPLGLLMPPPSRWGAPRGRAAPAVGVEPKVLARIRALLAKAEATTFPDEADSFTAKAQELMARHAIDEAFLRAAASHDARSVVEGRRVHITDPYAEAKVQLLAVVANANTGRAIWDKPYGFATVMAHATDLELIDILFTSLLVQATQAAAVAGRAAGRARGPAFRRAFLMSYAVRIGVRLREARQQVEDESVGRHGTALVPVLAARTAAVEDAVRTAFPRLETRAPRSFDADGWRAGRLAADLAVLGADRARLPG